MLIFNKSKYALYLTRDFPLIPVCVFGNGRWVIRILFLTLCIGDYEPDRKAHTPCIVKDTGKEIDLLSGLSLEIGWMELSYQDYNIYIFLPNHLLTFVYLGFSLKFYKYSFSVFLTDGKKIVITEKGKKAMDSIE